MLESYPYPSPGGWTIDEFESVVSTYVQVVDFFEEAAKQKQFILISPG